MQIRMSYTSNDLFFFQVILDVILKEINLIHFRDVFDFS